MSEPTFAQHVREALDLFHDPPKLGRSSPLASPYFLSNRMTLSEYNPLSKPTTLCGELLRNELYTAALQLWDNQPPNSLLTWRNLLPEIIQAPRTPRYSCLVLELHYFQKFFKPASPRSIWEEYLLRSRATYFRDLDIAVMQLSEILLNRLHPTLRLEFPAPSPPLIGYQPLIHSIVTALGQKATITIHGAGGVGKSAIGAAVVNRITDRPIFWYTFRLTLNDRLSNLLFTLGHFLHRQGAANLWQLVLASGGEVSDLQVAYNALLADIAKLADSPPILCFDEIERLEIATPEQANPAHLQLIEFMGSLRPYTSLFFIGQRPVIESDLIFQLHGLDQKQTYELCATRGINISEQSAVKLQQQTNGNPRLLLLCLLLVQRGESLDTLRETLAQNISLYPIIYRLWQRLTEGERDLLRRLAVFRSPTPLDHWQAHAAHLQNLLLWQLIRIDDHHGVELLPLLRTRIYEDFLSVELRQALHCQAAIMRSGQGEYTAAAYHYAQGQANQKAIQLWYDHHNQELRRGQAHAALTIFQNISSVGLDAETSNYLLLIRSALLKQLGKFSESLQNLALDAWQEENLEALQAHMLRGELLETLGETSKAQVAYTESYLLTKRLLAKQAEIRGRLGMLHFRQREIALARQETQRCECIVLKLQGELAEEEGRYDEAEARFRQLLAIAEYLKDADEMAWACRKLANIFGDQQKLPEAENFARRALAYYEDSTNFLEIAKLQNNLANAYLTSYQFAQAIEVAQQAFRFAEAANVPYHIATSAAVLATAHLELHQLTQARSYVERIFAVEEPQAIPNAFWVLGGIAYAEQHWQSAENYYRQSIEIAREQKNILFEAYALTDLAKTYQTQGKREDAIRAFQNSITLFEKFGVDKEVQRVHALLSQVF